MRQKAKAEMRRIYSLLTPSRRVKLKKKKKKKTFYWEAMLLITMQFQRHYLGLRGSSRKKIKKKKHAIIISIRLCAKVASSGYLEKEEIIFR